MRPRVFPAEDSCGLRGIGGHLSASMRPRVFPAEDLDCIVGVDDRLSASMRPRVFPAEDVELERLRLGNVSLQ